MEKNVIIDKVKSIFFKKQEKGFAVVDGMFFATPSELCKWRADTLFQKEPQTINWIDTFAEGDVLWDIGANVGIYTVYAATRPSKIKVYAFEPSPFNFSVLSENIYLNKISERVSPFCIAFSDKTKVDYLNLTSINEGAAHTSFHNKTNEFGEEFNPVYSQSTIGYRADEFFKKFNLEPPTHLKIDVDGAEKFVIDGAANILISSTLQSILIEMNTDLRGDEKVIFDKIIKSGFYLERSDHPVDKRLLNYIFRRKQ